MLIPGRFPSSRKHKPPSSIIHQVLNFIKEPPDTRAGCSTLLPGWESAGSGSPEGPWQEARPVSSASGWAILLSEEADSTRTLVSLLPLFINKQLLLIPPGSFSHCKAKYKTQTVFLSSNELIAPLLFTEVSTITHRMHLQ